ncbi:carnitine transporter [Microbotryomycetes sp. JL221]|nr:carnitine transporter [Microbotryomycetes sp. JL221]
MATSTTKGTPTSSEPAPGLPKSTLQPAVNPNASAASTPPKQADSRGGVKSFLSGGFGGVCAVLVGQPFDLTKTRLQTAAPGQYKGTLDVVKQTFARDGLRGFYRGMGPPLAGVTPMFAVSFWASLKPNLEIRSFRISADYCSNMTQGYDMGKKIVYGLTPQRSSKTLSNAELAFAGFFSAVPTTLVAAPVERVKVLLQMQGQGGKQLYNGPLDAVGKLYKEGGLRSIYRGTGATLARDGPGSAAYFLAYEAIKKTLTPQGQDPSELSLSAVVVAGGFAGVTMWTFAIPPDVIKSRLQGAPNGTYKGFLDCAAQTVRNDGVKALFKGFGPAMLRAFPANAATFLGVELSIKFMNTLW